MRHVPPGRDSNIAVNGCSGFATSAQKGPFTAMLISHSRGTYLIGCTIVSYCISFEEMGKRHLKYQSLLIKTVLESDCGYMNVYLKRTSR